MSEAMSGAVGGAPVGLSALAWFTDDNLLGKTFAGPTFVAGRALVATVFGLASEMTPEMLAIARACTERTVLPSAPVSRATIAAGRGSGKTLLASAVCIFLAASRDFRRILGPGELATVMLLAPDRKQARVAFRYVRGLLRQSSLLESLVVSETQESVTLSTSAIVEIASARPATMRGYGLAGLVIDEASFLPAGEMDAAHPDIEIERAALPALARVPGSLLLTISTVYARRGILWQHMQRWHGVDGAPVLTWKSATRVMNPTIGEDVIAQALAEDETAAAAEWLSVFRDDLESFISSEALRAVTVPGRGDLPPVEGHRHVAFTDVAGGGGGKFADSFATCIAHAEGEVAVVDAVLEIRPPFSPDAAVTEVVELLRRYGIRRVVGDKWGGEWPTARFAAHRIVYTPSELTRSEIFLEALPFITAGRVELPDCPRLLHQLAGLERRRGRSGKDSVDHAARAGAHDDLANACCGALVLAAQRRAVAPMGRPGVGMWGRGGSFDPERDTAFSTNGQPLGPSTARGFNVVQDVAGLIGKWK